MSAYGTGHPWRTRGHQSNGYRSNDSGRGKGRGNALPTSRPGQPWRGRSEPPQRPPSPPLGPVLTTWSTKDLAASDGPGERPAKITDCECIASYSWLNEKEPTILVPGKPPTWTPLHAAVPLKEDSGTYFRDPNAARYPSYPIEPAVRALLAEHEGFPTTSIDVFGCGSTIGNLLRFIQRDTKPFRFLVEMVGNTVFFVRRENSPTETIPDVRGYGHSFPEAYTTWDADVKGSEFHQRIIRYKFGGLSFLVRFESDGYQKDLVSDPEPGEPEQPSLSQTTANIDEPIPASFDTLLAVTSLDMKPSLPAKELTIKTGGRRIPQEAVFELKTRSAWRKDHDLLSDQIARLWVRQIPNFIVAYHKSGSFEDIRIRNVRKEIDAWELLNQHNLRLLTALIRKIIGFAKSSDSERLEVRCVDHDVLEIREQADRYATLLPHIKAHWVEGEKPRQFEGGLGKVAGHDVSHEKEREQEAGSDDGWLSAEEKLRDWDNGSDTSEPDFTACSAEGCGYCGHCSY
ncbi:MAG: hypothetical protein M1819_004655 [Sarea resinae]|nr:MAG: hypothetical protein M1819_004655 [Sarea resinae]